MEDGKGKAEDGRRRKMVVQSPSSILRFPSSVSRWAPVLLWTAGIFYFSSRPDPLAFLPSSPATGRGIDVENLAHMGEYAGLAALLYRALAGRQQTSRDTKPPTRGDPLPGADLSPERGAIALAFSMALAYALADELHQSLVPGRDGEVLDIGYDVVGMVVAMGGVWLRGRFLAAKANARGPASRE